MIGRKHLLAVGLVTASAFFSALPGLGMGSAAIAAEQDDVQAQGVAALKVFLAAAVAGTPQAFDPVLAPEFQIERADGSGLDKQGYLKSNLPKFAAMPEVSGVKVTGTGDILVVRYDITLDATRDGKRVQRHAPRLTVFRKQGDAWLVVAHANFATLEK